MAETEHKPNEGRDRKVECPCGVTLDLRTQGLLCPGCRVKFRMERRINMAAAWERFHRRHSPPGLQEETITQVEELIDAVERLVRAHESDRPRYRQTRPSTSPVGLSTPPAAAPRRAGGLPVDRLEAE